MSGGVVRTTSAGTRPSGRIRVLHALPGPDGTTQYVDHLIGGVPPEIETLTFSWPRAIFGAYDVLHLHRPRLLVRQARGGRLAGQLLTAVLLLRLELTETPVVRTVHDRVPHAAGDRLERRLLDALDRRTALWIRLDPTTALPPDVRTATIPHGHYRSAFPPRPGTTPEPGRLAQIGPIRRDVGTDRLLEVFGAIDDPSLRLTVAGRPQDDALAGQVAAAAAADVRVTLRLDHLADDELAREVRHAELVVLPCAPVHDAGAALIALSLDRPVLVPRDAATDALAREVGEGWVLMFDGALQRGDLLRALAAARLTRERGVPPRLDDRDWELVGRRHADVYRRVAPDAADRR